MLALLFLAVLALGAWAVLITGPCVVLGRIIARAFVRFLGVQKK